MTKARRTFLQDVMNMAWGLYRADLRSPDPRTFADALAGSWRWFKGRAARVSSAPAWARAGRPVSLHLGSMVHSPIRRSLTGAYAGDRARTAGYLTSMVGR